MREALILFISLFIHWSIAPENNQVVVLWQSWGGGEGTFPLIPHYAYCQNPICFWNEKSVSSAGVDLWKWHSYTKHRHTWAESHVYADTYILHRHLATPLLDVYLNEIASNDKMTAIDKNRIFLLHFSQFICSPILDILPYIGWISTDSVTSCPCFIYYLSIYFSSTLSKNKIYIYFFFKYRYIKTKSLFHVEIQPWVLGLRQKSSGPTSDPARCPAGRWTRKLLLVRRAHELRISLHLGEVTA